MLKFSILTPSYNRKEFLPNLLSSLNNQTFKDFEWIIGDDGSNDGTENYLLNEVSKIKFPLTYIKSNVRVGKSKIDNTLLDHARGDYLIWCDSDDYFLNDALAKFSEILDCKNDLFERDLIGIIAQNIDTNGVSQTFDKNINIPPDGVYGWEEIENFMTGDGTICIKKEIFDNQRWPEVDFLIIEGILLRKIYESKKFFFTSSVLKVMDRSAENSVSHGNKMQYCRGSVYAMAETIGEQEYVSMTYVNRIKSIINYFRYSIHGEISIKSSINFWNILQNRMYLVLIYPISLLIAFIDIVRNKVEKTHREFDMNKNRSKITIKLFNYK
tara:strand:- start:357 stop:1337 length:981 start_codon:yes stop_codon:yes gene_type:complete